MAAFQGGCTLEAAEAVCNPRGDLDLLELMTSLLEKSLIKHELRSGEPRFSMLKTIWEYASELLNEGDDNDLIRSAHSDFFLTLISAAHDGLRSAGQVAWLGRLERDSDNLRTALRWCLDHDQAEAVAEAGWTLWLFWWLNAHLAEGKQLMDETLERGGLSGVGLAKARAVKGCMAFWQGDYPDALPLLAAALESFREHHDLAGVALCQLPLGFVEGTTGSPAATRERLEQSVSSFKQVHDEWGTALAMNALCWTAVALDLGVGDEVFEEALVRAEKLGTELDVGMALRNLGTRRADEGHNDEAKGLLVKALRRLWRGYVHGGSSYTLEALAEIAAKEGNPDLAVRLFAATDAIREKMNSRIVPMFVPRFEDFLNGLRSEMGSGFELAWAAGRRLSMNDAVELSLAWADGKRSDAISVEADLRNGRTSTLT
jgi:tetratricopeptide (TPR) repeat protein